MFPLNSWSRLISWQRDDRKFFSFLPNVTFSSILGSDLSSLSPNSVIQWSRKQEKRRSLCVLPHCHSSAELVIIWSPLHHITIGFDEIDLGLTFIATHPLIQANLKKLSNILWPKGHSESGFAVFPLNHFPMSLSFPALCKIRRGHSQGTLFVCKTH